MKLIVQGEDFGKVTYYNHYGGVYGSRYWKFEMKNGETKIIFANDLKTWETSKTGNLIITLNSHE